MLTIETLSRRRIRLSYGAKNEVWEVRLENGIIQGNAFSPLLFVLVIDFFTMVMKTRRDVRVENLQLIDDLKASSATIETAQTILETVKRYADSVGMVINAKKSAIQFNVETPLPVPLGDPKNGRDVPVSWL